jgi:hypothetical protein
MCEERVREALKALRRADAGVETGPEAGIRALLAFRRQQRRRRLQRMAVWSTMAAAVALAAMLWPARKTPQVVAAIKAPVEIEAAAIPVLAPPPPLVKRAVRKPAEPEEIVTAFYPLMDSPPPFERGLLVRMIVPASAMRTVGLPVGEDHLADPVQADVLVGQDDLARAIRFVSYRK